MISFKLCEWINFLTVGWLSREWVEFNRSNLHVVSPGSSLVFCKGRATKTDDDFGTNNRQYYLRELTCNSGMLPMIVGGKIS